MPSRGVLMTFGRLTHQAGEGARPGDMMMEFSATEVECTQDHSWRKAVITGTRVARRAGR